MSNHRVEVYNLYYYRMQRRNRQKRPLTQRECAMLGGITLVHYGSLERGKCKTTEATRKQLAKALGVTVEQLATPRQEA